MEWSVGAGLEGKGVIVTGAAGGMGRPVAQAFARTGAKVMAVDLDQEAAESVVADLDGTGHVAVGVNLADLSTHAELISLATRELGGVYVLAHLAAVLQRRNGLDDVTEQDWDLQLDVNLKAAFFLCRAAGSEMIRAGAGGRMIVFSSQGWWTGGFGGSVVYATSKGGVVTMVRGLARTYGPHGITVNSVSPGMVDTPMLTADADPAVLKKLTDDTPLGRIADPTELAGPVVFLASDHGSFVSGATLNVSGGMLMY